MSYHDRLKRKRLGDILVDEDIATKGAVITALHEHHQTSRPLSEILIEGGELREYDLARVVVQQYQLPYLDLQNYTYHRELIAEFPVRLLHEARVVPLDRHGDVVTFGVQEMPAPETVAELKRHASAGRVFLFAAMAAEIRQALHDHAPLRGETLYGDDTEAVDEQVVTQALSEDGSWKELFDAANEAIVSDLDPDLDTDPDEVDEPATKQGTESVKAKAKGKGSASSTDDEMPSWLAEG